MTEGGHMPGYRCKYCQHLIFYFLGIIYSIVLLWSFTIVLYYMTCFVTWWFSGLITAIVLCRENAISHWRAMMGNTKVYRLYFLYYFMIISQSVYYQYQLCWIADMLLPQFRTEKSRFLQCVCVCVCALGLPLWCFRSVQR